MTYAPDYLLPASFLKIKTVKKAILHIWISVCGSPQIILTDNRETWVNKDFIQMSNYMRIGIKITPTESPWSNEIVK